jgi:hypothetical protein
VIGIDPTTGAPKFTVQGTPFVPNCEVASFGMIVAGDGYAYFAYEYSEIPSDYVHIIIRHVMVLRVNSSGESDNIDVYDYANDNWGIDPVSTSMITNADQGILLTWNGGPGMATITGGSATVVNAPQTPGGSGVIPVLQAQDGSFIGVATDPNAYNKSDMVSFDAAGNVLYIVPNETPQIATDDGGVIGQSGIAYDANGNATGQVNLFTQSWSLNAYQDGPVTRRVSNPINFGVSFWPFLGANESGNSTAKIPGDWRANDKVNEALSDSMWQKFANSHCNAVLGTNPGGIPQYSVQMFRKKQYYMTNFYDTGRDTSAALTLRAVTEGRIPKDETLAAYLGATTIAATANPGYGNQTAVVLRAGVLSQPYTEFILVHELLHAYSGLTDDMIFLNAVFQKNGLWRPAGATATVNISTWMRPDCTCTPGGPVSKCQANTANWGSAQAPK